MAGLFVKKGDTVLVVSGKDRGVKGRVISASPDTNRVLLMETRPLSASKRWRVVEVLEKAK